MIAQTSRKSSAIAGLLVFRNRKTTLCKNCDIHTNSENFDFTDVHLVVNQRKLDNDVSEAKCSVVDVSTVDSDCDSVRHSARILTTHSVVPQNRCVKTRMIVGQTDNKVVRSVTYTNNNRH